MPPQTHAEFRVTAASARIVLVVAIGVFLAQGWYLAGAQVGYNEEVVGHAAPPATELVVENHVARAINICDGHSWIAFSRGGDPHLVLCAGGLAWPILVNSYIGGVLYWPLQVLRPLHHGNLIALRRTALPIGALALLVLFLLVERLGGALCAALTVLVTAVFPAVVIMHSVLSFFNSYPRCSSRVRHWWWRSAPIRAYHPPPDERLWRAGSSDWQCLPA